MMVGTGVLRPRWTKRQQAAAVRPPKALLATLAVLLAAAERNVSGAAAS